jgi:hypothetical protein
MCSLSDRFGQRWSSINAEVDLFVQEAILVADDEAGFRIIFGD